MELKVYRATATGFDRTGFIIAAKDYDDALEIARDADMGYVDDVWEIPELSTTQTEGGIIEQF